ncbi:10743_t:CDS:2, partial [Racocetra fulgida]
VPTPVCDWAIYLWIPAADVWKLGLATPIRTHSLSRDKARKLEESTESTFQRQEAMTNATKNLTNAIRDFVNESENLYEAKLEARVITRRIEDINHDNCEEKAIEEELHSYDFYPTHLTNVLSQQTISLLSILTNYCAKSNTSPYDFILDLSPTSKIRNEFSYEQWSELSKRPEVVKKTFHQEIEPFIVLLFENNVRINGLKSKILR